MSALTSFSQLALWGGGVRGETQSTCASYTGHMESKALCSPDSCLNYPTPHPTIKQDDGWLTVSVRGGLALSTGGALTGFPLCSESAIGTRSAGLESTEGSATESRTPFVPTHPEV